MSRTEKNNDAIKRMELMNADSMLLIALRKCEPGHRKGNISKCWKALDSHVRYTAAKMHVLEFKSARQISDDLGEMMGSVDCRSLSGWLKTIRSAYGQIHDARLAEQQSIEQIAFASGDLVAVLGMTFSAIAPKFISWIQSVDLVELENKEQHVILRFLETQTTAAKVQSEAMRSEAQTQLLHEKIKQSAGVITDEHASPKTKSEAIKAVSAMIDELTGVRTKTGGAS